MSRTEPCAEGAAVAEVLGPIGVRLRRLRVERAQEIEEKMARLPWIFQRITVLVPREIAPALGGAVLRSALGEIRGERYFEAEVTPHWTELRRV